MILTDCDIEVGGGAAIRITRPMCPCGGEYAVKDGSINCKACGKPMHMEPLKKINRWDEPDRGKHPAPGELFVDEGDNVVAYDHLDALHIIIPSEVSVVERYYETLNDHDDEYVHELCEEAEAKRKRKAEEAKHR